jgi:hypothetical protein
VLLSGEPGIGKSRLTAALLERVAPEPHTRLRYFCSPQRTDSVLFPINSRMERAAGFTHADSGQVKLDKLDAVLALSSTSKQDAALFAEMLSLPNDGRYPSLELTPQQRRQKTLEALFAQVESPVLIIFEDAHWSDPTSLEAFGRAVDRITNLSVLLLITFRPEFEPPWIGHALMAFPCSLRKRRGQCWKREAKARVSARLRPFHLQPWRSIIASISRRVRPIEGEGGDMRLSPPETQEPGVAVRIRVGARLAVHDSGLPQMVARLGVAAKFQVAVHPHMLRHACGYKLANQGVFRGAFSRD